MDGILVVDKPKGKTSHDVVDIIRGRFNIRRVGHTGSLDPMATGVLVILLGKATKLSNIFIDEDKEYEAVLFLGKRTDSQDAEGRVLEEKIVNDLSKEDIKNALNNFLGEIEQVPPMVSAKKYKGTPLYKLARKGKSVPRKSCPIRIYNIELLDVSLPEVKFRIQCSKGTYIRTLCEDIGKVLGYPAHMSRLVRTKVGRFSLDDTVNLNRIKREDVRTIVNGSVKESESQCVGNGRDRSFVSI